MKRIAFLILLLPFLTRAFAQDPDTERKLGIRPLEIKLIGKVPNLAPGYCRCDNNLVKDGGFRTVTVSGSDINAASPIWKKGSITPQWSPTMGCCDSGFVSMWGNKTFGEAVSQYGVTFIAGKKYRISFCGRFVDQTGAANPFVRFRFLAGSTLIGYSPDITNTGWNTYTVPEWTAPAGVTGPFTIAPENDNTEYDGKKVSWGQIDNVCVQEVSCECGNWGATSVSSAGFDKKVKCGQTVTVKRGAAVTIRSVFYCTGGCEAKYTSVLTGPSGQVQNFSGSTFSFTPTSLGNYKLTTTPVCGDKKCAPCTIYFFAVPGCPGEVSGGKFDDLEVTLLTEYPFDHIREGVFLPLTVKAEAGMLDIPDGGYRLAFDKTGTKLLDEKNTAVRTWARPVIPGNPCGDCQQQDDAQWEQFRQNQLPGLLAMANQQCRAVNYCLTVYCNGQPRTFYLLVIKPTNPKCKFYTAEQYQAAVRPGEGLLLRE